MIEEQNLGSSNTYIKDSNAIQYTINQQIEGVTVTHLQKKIQLEDWRNMLLNLILILGKLRSLTFYVLGLVLSCNFDVILGSVKCKLN